MKDPARRMTGGVLSFCGSDTGGAITEIEGYVHTLSRGSRLLLSCPFRSSAIMAGLRVAQLPNGQDQRSLRRPLR